MKFPRSKVLVLCNNKGGVGKTTLAYNLAKKMAGRGYKTVLMDLDPQCNLSLLALGREYFERNLFDGERKNVYDVLRGIVEGGADVQLDIPLEPLAENLSLLPGSLNLTLYEELLSNASFNLTASGQARGFLDTSALDRFMRERGMEDEVDLFIVDTSPNLGLLNKVILLGADYFLVPMEPDAFSLQGIENLGLIFEKWKKSWKNTARAMAGEVPQKNVLTGEALFLGYVVNSFRPYAKQMIRSQRDWLQEIPAKVKEFLSLKHCKNGLVEKSWQNPLAFLQEYGTLATYAQEKSQAIYEISELSLSKQGTQDVLQKARLEFDTLADALEPLLEMY